MPSCSAAEGLRNNHPANLLRACGSSADVGLNEQKIMPKASRVFSHGVIRRRGIVVIHLHSCLFHGNKLLTLPKRNPSFYPPCPRA